jgi:hypothetical protein
MNLIETKVIRIERFECKVANHIVELKKTYFVKKGIYMQKSKFGMELAD